MELKKILSRYNLFYTFPVILYAVLIFLFSSLPSNRINFISSVPDYLLHFVEYGILAFLVLRMLRHYGILKTKVIITALLFMVVFAVADEWHQSFVPGRTCSAKDVLADSLGMIVVTGIYAIIRRKDSER